MVVYIDIQQWISMNSMVTIYTLLQKKKKKKKNVFLLSDFNVGLLKYDKHGGRNEFINSLFSYMFLPYIWHSSRVTDHSQTTTDNIFSMFKKKPVCGNLTSTIYDDLPQVLFISSVFPDNPATKSNIFESNWTNFNQDEFLMNSLIKIWVISWVLNMVISFVYDIEYFIGQGNSFKYKYTNFRSIYI